MTINDSSYSYSFTFLINFLQLMASQELVHKISTVMGNILFFMIHDWEPFPLNEMNIFKRYTGILFLYRHVFMVFNATFNNISVTSWRSVLLVEETGVPG
jgi:hypothetical protein